MRSRVINHIYFYKAVLSSYNYRGDFIFIKLWYFIALGIILFNYFSYFPNSEGFSITFILVSLYKILQHKTITNRIKHLVQIRLIEFNDLKNPSQLIRLDENFNRFVEPEVFKGTLSRIQPFSEYELFHNEIPNYGYREDLYTKFKFSKGKIQYNQEFELYHKVSFSFSCIYEGGSYYSLPNNSFLRWFNLTKIFKKKVPALYLAMDVSSNEHIIISEFELSLFRIIHT